jgi:O-antigen/teichoic acid export membrane protein
VNIREIIARLTSQSLVYGLGQAGGRLIQLILVPILTRVFHPAEYGVIELVMLIFAIVSLLAVSGMDAALARFFYEQPDRKSKRIMATTSALHRVVTGSFLGLVLIAFAPQISILILGSPDYAKYVRIIGLTLPFSGLYLFANEALRVTFQPWKYIVLNAFEMTTVGALTIYFVVVRDYSVSGVLYARLIADVLATGFALVLLRHTLTNRYSWKYLKMMVRYGIPLVPVALTYSVLTYADRQVLLHMSSLSEVGVYSVAIKLAAPVMLAVTAFNLAWGPMAFSNAADPNAGRLYSWVLSLYTAAGATLALAVALYAPEILAVFVPEAYRGAAAAGGLLAFGAVAHGAYYIAALGANLERKNEWLVVTTGVAATVTLTLAILLVRPHGGTGVAAATLIGFCFSTGSLYFVSQRLRHFPFRGMRSFLVFAIAVGIATLPWIVGEPLTTIWAKALLLVGYTGMALLITLSGRARGTSAGKSDANRS